MRIARIFFIPWCVLGSLTANETWITGQPQMHSEAVVETTQTASGHPEPEYDSVMNISRTKIALARTEGNVAYSGSPSSTPKGATLQQVPFNAALFPNFTAVTLNDSGFIPPDSDGA